MKIGNEEFKIKGTMLHSTAISKIYDDFDKCYSRPSDDKKKINKYWYELLCNNCDSVLDYGVCGYNCHLFSLNAIIKIKNKMYYVYITKTKQEIYELEEV